MVKTEVQEAAFGEATKGGDDVAMVHTMAIEIMASIAVLK